MTGLTLALADFKIGHAYVRRNIHENSVGSDKAASAPRLGTH